MSERSILSLKPALRLEWRGQDGQNETEQLDHSASLGDSITSSTRIGFSVHTGEIQLRPVLMTSVIAGVGLLPAAVSTGIGSQVQKPLAVVVVGGMMLAPAIILITLPALIALFSRRTRSGVSEETTFEPAE
jgi:hypothetical protein